MSVKLCLGFWAVKGAGLSVDVGVWGGGGGGGMEGEDLMVVESVVLDVASGTSRKNENTVVPLTQMKTQWYL